MKLKIIVSGMVWLFCCYELPAQDTLSMEAYKQKVLSYNQSIQIATQTVAAAKAAAKEVKTAYFPVIGGMADYSYNFNPASFQIPNGTLELSHTSWGVGANLQQNLYTGGRLSAMYNAAKIQEDMAVYTQAITLDNIAYMAETTYWNAVATKELLNTSNAYLQAVQELYDLVSDRFEDGLISRTDLLKATTSLKDAEYQVSKAEQAMQNSQLGLAILAGMQDTLLVTSDSIRKPVDTPSYLPLSEVLSLRPDYLISYKEIDLQKELKKADRSEFLPTMMLGASANYGTPPVNFKDDPLFYPLLFAQLNVPIFHWGKSKQTANRHKALIRSKELSQSYTADNIRKELATALTNMEKSAAQVKIAAENLVVAEKSLELHTFSYKEGRLSLLDVQAAQLAWLQARVNVIVSQLSHKQALAEYTKVVSK